MDVCGDKIAPPSLRKARIAVLSSTTTALLAPILQLACFRDGIDAEIYEAPYGKLPARDIEPQL